MQSVYYSLLAVVPYVLMTILLRQLIQVDQWPVGLVGTFSRVATVPLLAAWVLCTGTGWRQLRPRGKGGWLLLMGAISIFIHLLWYAAQGLTNATNVALIFRCDLVFVVAIGAMLGLERIGKAQLALLPVMLVGLALVIEIDKFAWGTHVVGDLMMVAAALGYAVNAFVIRHIMQVMDESAVALYNHGMNMAGFVAYALVCGDFSQAPDLFRDTAACWLTMLAGTIAAVGLPLYYVALRRMDVWKLRTFMLMSPVLAAGIEWSLWGLPVSRMQGLGALIILGGLAALIRVEARTSAKSRTSADATVSAPPESE